MTVKQGFAKKADSVKEIDNKGVGHRSRKKEEKVTHNRIEELLQETQRKAL